MTRDKDDDERKERVIHTRVPESLENELRTRAQDLGISVSNLVRNVLGHAFGLVGDVVADGHAIARAARGDRDARDEPPPSVPAAPMTSTAPNAPAAPAPKRVVITPTISDVLGWQRVTLAKNAICARCNAILPRGSDAAIGIVAMPGDAPTNPLVICVACLDEINALH